MTSDPFGTKVLVRAEAGTLWRDAVALVAFNGERVRAVTSGTSPSAGMETIEMRGVKMVLTRPRARYIISEARPLYPAFCLGNFLYFLSGSDEVAPLQYYNGIAEKFSDDGVTLHGAYAPRIQSQLHYLRHLLRADPASRRGVTVILNNRDIKAESKDIPCPISFQFLIRNGELEMHVMLRSQNIAMVFPYDIFLFTMIQEWLARDLDLDCGTYVQYCASLHYYQREVALAEAIVSEQTRTFIMPQMTKLGDMIGELVQLEAMWRDHGNQVPKGMLGPIVRGIEDDPYWGGVCRMLEAIAQRTREGNAQIRDDSMIQSAWATRVD